MTQTSPDFLIRPANDTDWPVIRYATRRAWEKDYSHIYTPDEMDGLFKGSLAQYGSWTQLRKQRVGTLVAEAEGRVIGYIGLALMHNGDGEISNLYLNPDYHGRGIGKALWDAGISLLREYDCAKAWVWVLAKAPAYHQFYLRQGCEPQRIGTYHIGAHIEKALGCVLQLKPTSPDVPVWLTDALMDTHYWVDVPTTTMEEVIKRYSLYGAQWIGMWHNHQTVMTLELDPAFRKRPGYLLVHFAKVYQVIMSDLDSGDKMIDRFETHTVTEMERKVWSQLITAQTLIGGESADYLLDDHLQRTSIIGLSGDVIHLFHTAAVQYVEVPSG